MATMSFKADGSLKMKLEALAERKGINTSACIKLILTEGLNSELTKITENGLTVAEELNILASDENDAIEGPFTTARSLMKALKKK